MTDRDPTHLDYRTFPPAMLMSVSAVAVRLHDTLSDAAADTWRKTFEVFASGLGVQVEQLPSDGRGICLHLGGDGGVGLRSKGMVLNWLALSRDVQAVRVLDASHRKAKGLTVFVDRATKLLIAP
ncbi:hypothetical protein D621_18085 [beta proteobacterium AAP51]|nr:hypothetical protein D621_18085 [beta proteobacterium AAP51]